MLPDIRNLYVPVQPTVSAHGGAVSYSEFLPAPALQPYIYCYWQLKTSVRLSEPFVYRVVADGCIDIYMERANPAAAFIMGFCRQYTEFPLEPSFDYVGIRFLPGMLPLLFGIHAAELSNRYAALADVLPELAALFRECADPTAPLSSLLEVFNDSIRACLSRQIVPDTRFYGALALILQRSGVLDVEKDLDTGLSGRQLRRVFSHYIGDTPKTFSKVVRFQHVLRAKPSVQSLKQNKLFFDAGYYDQAHFIKEFKSLYGVTPGRAFGR
ncbi:helix-turn-helix domain-containing protein [Pedobacter sp. SYP-B3415]|uniref:AraC family transcriptional regulator n=1 Tax=Pedobacter sp. SYP-B3415 TaxID=2496641 RepID=UPI00101D43A8|nr:helix-turn-helix domain-containing protein [Pedobacter sp. SYP-B3415]